MLFLPTQQVGYSPEHSRFAGTLTLSFATVIATWIELGECVARAGVKKLLLLNSHGGQVSLMDIVARELRSRCNLIVYSCSWWNLPLGDSVNGLFSAEEHRFGVHAGEIETSMMLALRPQHVDMAQARDFKSSSQERAANYPILGNGSSAKLGWQMQDYNTAGRGRQRRGRHSREGPGGAGCSRRAIGLVAAGVVRLAAVHIGGPARLPDSIVHSAPTWIAGQARNAAIRHRRCPTPACEGTDSATTASR